MSHFRRKGGRFAINGSSEAYQRQMTAPVHKWKKAWVTPTGLAPESSYRVYKWTRLDDKDGDDFTPAPEDGEDGDEEEEDEGDADEDEEGEGDEGDMDVDEAEPELSTAAAPAAESKSEPGPDPQPRDIVQPTETDTKEPAAPRTTTDPPTEGQTTEPVPAEDSEKENIPFPSNTIETPAVAVPVPVVTDVSSPPKVIEHAPLPSNAIEIANVVPGGTELGHGDHGAAGIEVTRPEAVSPIKESATIPDERMDVDVDADVPDVPGSSCMAVDATTTADEADAALKELEKGDEGLIHGEVEAAGEKALEIADGDAPPELEQ